MSKKEVTKEEVNEHNTEVTKPVEDEKDEYTIEIIRDPDSKVDPFILPKKDPNYEYRFLRDDFKNMSLKTTNMLFQKGGWQICNKAHLRKLGIPERMVSPDGLYRVGDTILARMPKKLYEEKFAFKKRQAALPMDAVKRFVKDGDPQAGGVGQLHKTMKGFQTKKQLNM